MVTVQGMVRRTGASITGGSTGTIISLPAGFRPTKAIYASQARDGGAANMIFDNTGNVSAEIAGTWNKDISYVSFHLTFKAAAVS
jgi:hypothetical protein